MARGALSLAAILFVACSTPPRTPVRWPAPVDDDARLRVDGARTYLSTLEASAGDPPEPLATVLGVAGTRVRGTDPESRALLSAWILDAEVRRATRGQRSLRDVVSASPDPVDSAGWRAAAAEVSGAPLPAWSAQDAAATPLDYGAALHWFGVAWVDGDGGRSLVADPGASPQARARRARW